MSNKTSEAGDASADPIETLLYNIFVANSGRMSVAELAGILGVGVDEARSALSVACRLGFATRVTDDGGGGAGAGALRGLAWLDGGVCRIAGSAATAPFDGMKRRRLFVWAMLCAIGRHVAPSPQADRAVMLSHVCLLGCGSRPMHACHTTAGLSSAPALGDLISMADDASSGLPADAAAAAAAPGATRAEQQAALALAAGLLASSGRGAPGASGGGGGSGAGGGVAVVLDSEATSYLMMGALSPGAAVLQGETLARARRRKGAGAPAPPFPPPHTLH